MFKKSLVLLFVLLTLVSMAYAQDGTELPPPPGKMVDVGGYQMHIYCTGEGSPTVIMDAGHGDFSLNFRSLQDTVSDFTQVCTFDRAGYGWSEAGPQPRTSQQNVDELKILLENAEIEGPYVLVGHSLGGINMIMFANENPDLVAGVLLLDSSHPEQMEILKAEIPEMVEVENQLSQVYSVLAEQAAQAPITADMIAGLEPAGLPEDLMDTWTALFTQQKNLQAAADEYAALEESLVEAADHSDLGDIPLIVIAHGMPLSEAMPPEALEQLGLTVETLDKYEEIWRGLQEDHLTRSTNSKLVIAENSTHYVYVTEPELAVDAIKELAGIEE
ncbi:MAG TPA: alpha/beta hydrolase [Aggregatilineaceae bacterium]|nr:alpha/beta hydrolase [Aggregatilineaceae bacterium]